MLKSPVLGVGLQSIMHSEDKLVATTSVLVNSTNFLVDNVDNHDIG